jgi:molybdenum cofactor cytidylyltransferase
MSESKNIDGIILAAGLSSRIGSPKALLDYNGFNFLSNIIFKLSPICRRVIVVTGHQSDLVKRSFYKEMNLKLDVINVAFNISESELEKLVDKITFIENSEYEKGMFTSLQTGIRGLENLEHILYHFVDQPTLPKQFYERFVSEVDENTHWLQPVFNRKKGHPIIFSKHVADTILQSGFESNLREINKLVSNKKYWDCDFPEILDDIDTKSEYNKITMQKKV